MSEEKRRIAVIGAGASGLPAIKTALEDNFEVVCFEKSNDIGGLWHYKSTPCPGEGSVMKTTVINTSKEMTAYSDFPPPADAPNFMHNSELLKYFRLYANHFDLLKYIRFNHEVLSVSRHMNFSESGQWMIKWLDLLTNNTAVEIFDGVMVCSGHHTSPYWPIPFCGQKEFCGKIIHSHDYKDHKGFEDKTVIVVGIGNSGADIAVELSRISKKVYLATRSGSWLMNRVWDGGEPADLAYLTRMMFFFKKCIPWSIQNWALERKLEMRFDHGRYSLRPKHRFLSAHVTINDELPNRILSGTVVIKPNISKFTKNGVIFEDNSIVEGIDVVIFATGYSFGFPFLEDGNLIPVKENNVDLYQMMYPIALSPHNSLAIIGLIQPTGSIMPISEMQARLFVGSLKGYINLPNSKEMEKNLKKKQNIMRRDFVESRRHTIQVYYVEYMDELASIIGCKPSIALKFFYQPNFATKLFFHGVLPYQYRLQGPHAWKGARNAIMNYEERVFNATRTRKTPETMRSTPLFKPLHLFRFFL